MLASMLKEHQQRQAKKREEIEKKRAEAVKSAQEVTSALVDRLNEGVAVAYLNQRKLDSEAKQLVQNVNVLSRSVNQWLALTEAFNKSLKQLGDVENWARSIEQDMRMVSSALEYAYKVGQDSEEK